MENKPDNADQTERPIPEYQKASPPIFSLYTLVQEQPIILGAIVGVLLGLTVAAYSDIRTDIAIIGGAIIGAVIVGIIVRLRSIGKA